MDKQTLTHYSFSFTHWCFFKTAQMLLVSFWSSFPFPLHFGWCFYACFSFFLFCFVFSLSQVRLDAGIYKMWWNTNTFKNLWLGEALWFCVQTSYFYQRSQTLERGTSLTRCAFSFSRSMFLQRPTLPSHWSLLSEKEEFVNVTLFRFADSIP